MSYEMSNDEYEDFADMAENGFNLTVEPAYSGRGMYGGTCLAVVGSEADLYRFVFNFAMEYDHQSIIELIGEPPRRDNMGRSQVWYWPAVQS